MLTTTPTRTAAAERPAAAAAATPVPLLLRIEDAAVRLHLLALAGFRAVAEPEAAALVVTDRPPEPGDPPALVLAADAEAALRALRAGAQSVLPADAAPAVVVAALRAVLQGLAVLPATALDALTGRDAAAEPEPGAPSAVPTVGLTPREREVLALLAAGASNKVIARRLGLSFHTAKAHVAAVLHKLGAASRADAVARGARAGLVLL